MMNGQLSANELRQWSRECGADADRSDIRASDRQRLLKMQKALSELARVEDWLNPPHAAVIAESILPDRAGPPLR
jgi:hypothetical protein